MVISFSYLMIEAVRMKRIINHELLIKGKIKMKKILVISSMVIMCCIMAAGCSFLAPKLHVEEKGYYPASEKNNTISFKDYDNAYKLCTDIVKEFYSYSLTKAPLTGNNYNMADNLVKYKEKCFEKYTYSNPVNELVITNAVDDIKWSDSYVYISFATIVEFEECDEKSSFSDNNQFLVVNNNSKLKVVDWVTKGMGGVGSIDSILRKDESELHDISIWQDNNWAAEMIKHIQ